MNDKYCPLCNNKLTKKILPRREDGFEPVSYTCSDANPMLIGAIDYKISHYVEGDYGMNIWIEPYLLQAAQMEDKYYTLYVRNSDEELKRLKIPAFKIPCEEKFLKKIKLLLVFS